MFTGIIEAIGVVKEIMQDQDNLHLTISSPISKELKVDQSVSHNGVCLTVVKSNNETHTVTAIKETLDVTNLRDIQAGDQINLERCLAMNGRLDGHMVQGHVDAVARVRDIQDAQGSWYFTFGVNPGQMNLLVNKGSVCLNGVSLTVVDRHQDHFSVAIIPYTFEHTNFGKLKIGDRVNIEFDIIGKYLLNFFKNYQANIPNP